MGVGFALLQFNGDSGNTGFSEVAGFGALVQTVASEPRPKP